MTDAIKLAIDALEAGLDCAQEVAHRTHEELRGYKPHRHAAVDADVSKIEAALAALRARPASQYLCSGTPFKVAVRNGDAMLPYLPDELGGRWVALVAAEDDCHLRAQPDHSELVSAARAVVERWDTPLWKDAPATAGFINRLRDALPPAIGETME